MDFGLKGKVILITGADSGIGRATASTFAGEGADLALLGVTENQSAGLPIVSLVCTCLGLSDFNPAIRDYHIERQKCRRSRGRICKCPQSLFRARRIYVPEEAHSGEIGMGSRDRCDAVRWASMRLKKESNSQSSCCPSNLRSLILSMRWSAFSTRSALSM